MSNTQELRRRIKAIDNTRQITRAMEMVAATKMRRAQAAVRGSRAYADKAAELFQAVGATPEAAEHPLLSRGTEGGNRLALVVMTTDRGLAGALNANVLRHAFGAAARNTTGSISYISVGRKGQTVLRASGHELLATFTGLLDTPELHEVTPISRIITDEFLAGRIDRVQLVYPRFESTLSNHPTVTTLLPAATPPPAGTPEAVTQAAEAAKPSALTLFEPSPSAVLDSLVPRLLEVQLYQALLETKASEHSSRMVAMRNASNNASDLLDEVKFTLNQARQAAITTEIAEIAAAANL